MHNNFFNRHWKNCKYIYLYCCRTIFFNWHKIVTFIKRNVKKIQMQFIFKMNKYAVVIALISVSGSENNRAGEGYRCCFHWLIRLINSKCFIHLNTHKNYTLQKQIIHQSNQSQTNGDKPSCTKIHSSADTESVQIHQSLTAFQWSYSPRALPCPGRVGRGCDLWKNGDMCSKDMGTNQTRVWKDRQATIIQK